MEHIERLPDPERDAYSYARVESIRDLQWGECVVRTQHFSHSLNGGSRRRKNHSMITYRNLLGAVVSIGWLVLCPGAGAQVNSGSDGHDGLLSPTTNTVIDMADHPDGIYHYTSVNIPSGVTVSFIPNAANTPVVWLVQSNCVIVGSVNLNAGSPADAQGASGGPGGFRGGNGGGSPGDGCGPGGGHSESGGGSFGTAGGGDAGPVYGNKYLVPIIGGSGGAGGNVRGGIGGGGGGGAIMIVSSGTIEIAGSIYAEGGFGCMYPTCSGGGSGGGVRLVATTLRGSGALAARGGGFGDYRQGGAGRIRLDALV